MNQPAAKPAPEAELPRMISLPMSYEDVRILMSMASLGAAAISGDLAGVLQAANIVQWMIRHQEASERYNKLINLVDELADKAWPEFAGNRIDI